MKKIQLLFFILLSNLCLGQNPLLKIWDYRYGGTSGQRLNCFQVTSDGGYILGGYTASDSSGDMSQHSWGGWDYWIVKTDAFGIKQWDKRFGTTTTDVLLAICQTNDGGYVLGGSTYSGISGD